MIIDFEHVGMTVSDMDRSVAFYVGLLGLKLVVRRKGPAGNEMAFLDARGAQLEIVAPADGAMRAEDAKPGHSGLRHLTFHVESVDTAYAALEAAGVEMLEPPRDAHNRDIVRRVAFCRDPDGIVVELAERA